MTNDMMTLRALLEKSSDADLLREMIGFTAQRTDGAGDRGLRIPKLRKGSYFPGFLEPRRLAEKALAAVVQEAYVHGVSTRSVDDLIKAMGMTGISKSQVSRLCEETDEKVKAGALLLEQMTNGLFSAADT